MAVTEERLAEIWEIANGASTSALAFCRENFDPEELHAFADVWNWDFGTEPLEELLRNPSCEAATALMIYWRAGPEYFLQFADRQAVKVQAAVNLAGFDFVTDLEKRYLGGSFRQGFIAFDPRCSGNVGLYDDKRGAFVRELPKVMYDPVRPFI